MGKPEGTRLLGMLRRRRQDDIKRDLEGVSLVLINLARNMDKWRAGAKR